MPTSELIETLGLKRQILTVSQFSQLLQKNIQDTIPFVWISGELSGVFSAQSGHVYATIKDATSQMKIVIYQFVRKGIAFDITEGLHVHIGVQPTVYKPRGELQLIVKAMEPEGLGALQLAFEQTRAKLLSEGLFEAARKKSLPPYPKAIAVMTSKDGAVWHDILRVIERRYPIAPVILYPCSVQGSTSVKEIVAQLRLAAQENRADVYILARGGGSLTDLWSFNTEEVVRAIADFPWPIISAIGHETDVTLADFAADVRAPTPSIAAELATPSMSEIFAKLNHLYARLYHQITTHKRGLDHRADRLEQIWSSPALGLGALTHRIEKASMRLKMSLERFIQSRGQRLYKVQCSFRLILQSFANYLRQRKAQCHQALQKSTHQIHKQIHSHRTRLLKMEERLQSLDPSKALIPLSVVGEDGKLVLKAQSVEKNSTATLGFPDGQWRIRFLDRI